ncbi:NADPH:quinone reductase-like Zn-dependent oxidoreductase [Pedobacter cryoconitis]|uniref:quinone oxidoreductase family protein n=1 Tax=Pedobacter cryoconitis TaxID=188932 RepID=UPI001615C859|nr:zinc-binding alcohol dehydrogenase family protein [Pedobacter cryoconitis]MBB6271282.1 NADPH:quinone reductase-like Zn-dependent oxidoreductase [Pedobacter cryoconitis]
MKAAVLYQLGINPVYGDFPDPVPAGEDQILIHVKATAVKNIDKSRASGVHYASYKSFPVVVGFDGVGLLADGTKVYAQGITGMIAEQAIIPKNNYITLPENIDLTMAAALPNAVLGAAMALKNRANIKTGDVVLINGATGITGQIAVQIAKHYGASKVFVTGRNIEALQKLKSLGAEKEIISLVQEDEEIIKAIQDIHHQHPINIVLDYLWGHPMELILKSLQGHSVDSSNTSVKIVTVGAMAGESIKLESGTLRSAAIEILGSGLGSLSENDIRHFNTRVLPEMFQLAADGKLKMEIHEEKIEDIEAVWNKDFNGKRLVILID